MNWVDRFLSLHFTWRDAIDVLVVAFIIYNILALIRGTRAMQISIGLLLLASTFFVARAFDLPALEAISREILFYLPFAIIVLFQHEIRRALARMGTNPLLAFFTRGAATGAFEPVAHATEVLAAKRIGALIAMERTQSLRMYAETAKPLDAIVSAELREPSAGDVGSTRPGQLLQEPAVRRGRGILLARQCLVAPEPQHQVLIEEVLGA